MLTARDITPLTARGAGATLPAADTAPLSARGVTPRRSSSRSAWQTPRDKVGGAGDSLRKAGFDLTRGFKTGADPAPSVPTSGRPNEKPPAYRGLSDEIVIPTPTTPRDLGEDRLKHRRRTEAGEITVHWGLKDAKVPDAGDGYGIKSVKGEDVAQNFQSGQQLGIAAYVISRGEAIYNSTIHEPLGKSYLRGHSLPAETHHPDFDGFGKKIPMTHRAKETIFPRDSVPESESSKDMYKKTHGDYEPGETVNRRYKYPKAVTENPHFMYGATDPVPFGSRGTGVHTALNMDRTENGNHEPTRVVKMASEHYRQVSGEHIGKSHNMMQGRPPVPIGHTYGVKNNYDLNAGKLIQGFYSGREQQPDNDLGRCTVGGRRNYDNKAPMGVATLRTDLKLPESHKRRVTCTTNYGDELDAYSLICPNKLQVQNISDHDFSMRRTREDLRGIFDGAGYQLNSSDFNTLFNEAVTHHYDDGEPLVSLELLSSMYLEWMAAGAPSLAQNGAHDAEPGHMD